MDEAKLEKLLQKLQAVPYESWFDISAGYGTRIGDFTFYLHSEPVHWMHRSQYNTWRGVPYKVTLEVDIKDHGRTTSHTQEAIGPPGFAPTDEPSLFRLYASIPARFFQKIEDEGKARAEAAKRKLEAFLQG